MASPNGAAAVLACAVRGAEDLCPSLDAVYALGSLAHGGFAPLVSDVDVALVLSGRPDVDAISGRVRRECSGALAERLSLFWSDWHGVQHGGGGRLGAVDRLDLLDHGLLLAGRDLRTGAVRPTRGELVAEGRDFATARFTADYRASLRNVGALVTSGVRPVTKAVLFPVRFSYTAATGLLGRNQDAIAWYDGPARPLVQAASRWRLAGLDASADDLLTRHLLDLYDEMDQALAH